MTRVVHIINIPAKLEMYTELSSGIWDALKVAEDEKVKSISITRCGVRVAIVKKSLRRRLKNILGVYDGAFDEEWTIDFREIEAEHLGG